MSWMQLCFVSLGILAHLSRQMMIGVYNHLRNARYLGSMKPFSEGEPRFITIKPYQTTIFWNMFWKFFQAPNIFGILDIYKFGKKLYWPATSNSTASNPVAKKDRYIPMFSRYIYIYTFLFQPLRRRLVKRH